MPNCAVFGCNKRNQNTKGTNVKFYKFPKVDDLARQWLNACRRSDRVNLMHASICSQHFDSECFFTPLKHQLLQYSPKGFRNLKPDAVPTLNIPKSKDLSECSARQRRRQLKERRSLVQEILVTTVLEVGEPQNVSDQIILTGT